MKYLLLLSLIAFSCTSETKTCETKACDSTAVSVAKPDTAKPSRVDTIIHVAKKDSVVTKTDTIR